MTKYEDELQDIEHRMALVRMGKKSKVHPAEIEHLQTQRERERQREHMTKLMPEIHLRWHAVPKKWEPVTLEAEIGDQSYILEVEPYEEYEGKTRLKPKLVKLGFQKYAEDWALWKWHIARGSEVNDLTGEFILDCDAPALVWGDLPAKRGPKPKEQLAA